MSVLTPNPFSPFHLDEYILQFKKYIIKHIHYMMIATSV